MEDVGRDRNWVSGALRRSLTLELELLLKLLLEPLFEGNLRR